MIGMCTAFSIGNQLLLNGSQAKVFECTLLSTPPFSFSVVASAHDPTLPAAEHTSKKDPIKLWMVSRSASGSLSIDERRIPADTDVTFADIGHGLPLNIHAGCRYQPTRIQSTSFQLLRPDFRSLFDVDPGSVLEAKQALEKVRKGAVGQAVSKDLRDLLDVDPGDHKALKSALDSVKKSAVDGSAFKDLNVLFSVDPENLEALKSALDHVKQSLVGLQGADARHPGVIDFRNKLCHNLLTLDAHHFDALVACARNIFIGISSICPFIGDAQESEHARQSLDEIESIVERDMQVANLTEQEREALIRQHEQMLEEHDRLKVKLGRKFDSFAPCLWSDIRNQVIASALASLHSIVYCHRTLRSAHHAKYRQPNREKWRTRLCVSSEILPLGPDPRRQNLSRKRRGPRVAAGAELAHVLDPRQYCAHVLCCLRNSGRPQRVPGACGVCHGGNALLGSRPSRLHA